MVYAQRSSRSQTGSLRGWTDRKIAAAQEPDGYIYTTREIDPQHPHPWAGTKLWENEEILCRELYDLGQLG